jgi:hypothetical protein
LGVVGVEGADVVGLGVSLATIHLRWTNVPGIADTISSSSYASRSQTWHLPIELRLSGGVSSPGTTVLGVGVCSATPTSWNAECAAGANAVGGGVTEVNGCVGDCLLGGLYTGNVAILCSSMPRRSGVTTVVCRMRSRSSSGVEERVRGDGVWRSGDNSIIYNIILIKYLFIPGVGGSSKRSVRSSKGKLATHTGVL